MPQLSKISAVVLSVMMLTEFSLVAEAALPTAQEQTAVSSTSPTQLTAAQDNAAQLVTNQNELIAFTQPVAPSVTQVQNYYNALNQLIRKDTFTDGVLTQQKTYAYNPQGVRVQINTYNGQLQLTQQAFYDGVTGKIIQADNFVAGVFVSRQTFAYNAQGVQVQINSYNAQLKLTQNKYFDGVTGQYTYRETFGYNASTGVLSAKLTYNAANILIKKETYGQESWGGSSGTTRIFLYNPVTGKLVSQSMIINPAILYQERFYDASGLMTRLAQYNSQGAMTKVVVYNAAGQVIQTYTASTIVTGSTTQLWFSANQSANATGLVTSHPDDPNFIYHEGIQQEWAKVYANTQAYTYDQALAGIALLKEGNVAAAKKIFDFFDAERQSEGADFSGFWTVYNVNPYIQWKKYEWRKGMGENAWIALFMLRYSAAVTDAVEKSRALQTATDITKWIAGLPHVNGAVAMGPDNPMGNPNMGRVYSTENNLDYYAVLKNLKDTAADPNDRALFAAEFNALKPWLVTNAYDSASGLFKRGGTLDGSNQFVWDPIQSLDVNSWAISAIGVQALVDDFGINIDQFMSNIENTFAVQDNGTFGGNIFTAKGFDFSDSANASAIGRTGMKWVEGTGQMILAYKMIADYYALRGGVDVVKSAYYASLAGYFMSRHPENTLSVNGTLSSVYADQPNAQIYAGLWNYKTFLGQAAPSVGWIYFALKNLNPFIS